MSSASVRPALVILAAGLARRYGAPKQLEGFGPDGELLLDFTLRDARAAGFDRAILVVRPGQGDLLGAHVQARHPGLEAALAPQRLDDLPDGRAAPPGRERPWGTLHALLAARGLLDGPFAVANADDVYGAPALQAVARHLAGHPTACLVPYRLDQTLSASGGVSRAVVESRSGRLTGLREVLDLRETPEGIKGRSPAGAPEVLARDTPVSMNLWGFPSGALPLLESAFARWIGGHADDPAAECYLSEAVGTLAATGLLEVTVLETARGWLGVTHPGDAAHVREALGG